MASRRAAVRAFGVALALLLSVAPAASHASQPPQDERAWRGRSWTGRSWTGDDWQGRSWTSGTWSGDTWSTVEWGP